MSQITFAVRLDAFKASPLLCLWWKLYLSMQKNQTITNEDFELWFGSLVDHLISERDASPKIREETRRYFWELMTHQHTPLINQLYLKVAQHPNFADWQANHAVNADELMSLWRSFKKHPQFSTMPNRACVSARLVVGDTYESWLALQKERQEKLERLSRSLEMLKSDAELVSISGCSIDELRNTARTILSQVNIQIDMDSHKKKNNKATDSSIYNILYEKHRTTEGSHEKCAVAYLIKNRFEIKSDESEKDIENLNNRIHDKKKQIEILQRQLNSRLPKGRPWVEKDILDEIQSVGVIEDEAEWNLVESALLKQQTFMPHPILFQSSDDLIWFEHERYHAKNRKIAKKRYCIRFKSFDKKYAFEVSADRRHLHIIRQALKDRMIYNNDKSRNTSSLFLVRSATLIWKEYKKNENRIVRRKKAKNKKAERLQPLASNLNIQSVPEFYDPELPWNRYQLFLHCTIETHFLSEEGTQLMIEEKRPPVVKSIQTLEKKIVKLEAEGQSAKTSQASHSRKKGTLERLDSYNNNYERPSSPLYTGEPHILTSVALGSSKLVTVSIVDATLGKILECRGLKGLLGKNYQLVQRRQFQRQLNLRQRTERQKRGANNQFGESNLGNAIDRHIANSVIHIAKKHHSGCIVLPDMKDYRTQQQSKIAALAERECSGWKEVEKQFATAQNMKIHSWSYGRLIKYIQELAQKEEILVKIGRQPIDGTSQEQASQMAIAVYEDKSVQKKLKSSAK